MHILVYSMDTKATRRKAAVHYAAHSLSRGNLKNLMPRSSTFVCQLYCCSSKHNNNKALRITFNFCKTVSTSSMALATVNIDKIIKVTSASSYVCTSAKEYLELIAAWLSIFFVSTAQSTVLNKYSALRDRDRRRFVTK